jgi:hypothetical protein
MAVWLMNDELQRIWKEDVVAYFKVLSQHSHGGTEENHELSLVSVLAKSRIGHLLNIYQKRYRLSQLAR